MTLTDTHQVHTPEKTAPFHEAGLSSPERFPCLRPTRWVEKRIRIDFSAPAKAENKRQRASLYTGEKREERETEKKELTSFQSLSNSVDSLLTLGAVFVVSFDYNIGLKRH